MARRLSCLGVLGLAVLPMACTAALEVVVAGAGRGTVTGGGLSCRGICSTTTAGSSVTLTATADNDSTLVGWAGACSGTGASPNCSVTMGTAPATAVAYFRRTTVSAGAFHTCALKRSGALECWGRNAEGELADGTTSSPNDGFIKTLAGFSDFADVTAGGFHTCALAGDGSVWCWGDNTHSQVGNRTSGQPTSFSSPQQVSLINSTSPTLMLPSAISVVAGGYHTCALLMDQSVACWGFNQSGQVDAVHAGSDWFQPNVVSGVSGAVAIAAGAYHSCAIDGAGKVICWGYNADLELGVPQPSQGGFAAGNVGSAIIGGAITATQIAGGMGAGMVGTTNYGGYHSCAILTSGRVGCWGYGAFGELSGIAVATSRANPLTPPTGTPVTAIAAGGYHSCAVSGAGVECWGSNGFGQLGRGGVGGSPNSLTVPGLSPVTTVSAGSYHTCVVDSSAMVRCWGLNDNGQVGRTASNTKANPQLSPLVPLGF